jgi:hypothetical protein
MAKEGLLALFCASALFVASRPELGLAAGPEEGESSVASVLAVQTAMQRGRDFLVHNNPRAAVEVLERHLSRINGNATYLGLLRDAYRAYIKELRLANKEVLAQFYENHLRILEPGPAHEVPPRPLPPKSEAIVSGPGAGPTFRLYRQEDEDPFQHNGVAAQRELKAILTLADKEFGKGHFHEADQLYQQAQQADRQAIEPCKDRWAYCKMNRVVDQLNCQSKAYGELEKEVHSALDLKLSPPLAAYGRNLLTEIEKRRYRAPTPGVREESTAGVAVQDLGRTPEGWSIAETANFRIYHNLSKDWVDQVARVAEHTRTDMQRKWFGAVLEPWNPKCELYLHATAQEYSRATGVSGASPGHSTFHIESGRVLGRRVDLHCDDPGMLIAVLPHEATHVILAGNFGDHPVPRWADEGMAVLTEPRERIDRHLRNLPRHRQERQLFGIRQLVLMNDYPDPRYIGPFYAQSVSLVEFLSKEKGPEVFTHFLRDGLQEGYDAALHRHYGFQSFDELERRWVAYAFGEVSRPAGVVLDTP